jgi:Ca2+-dependent lipid-binding protein
LRLHVIRGQNLKAADFGFMQSGKSDPYVKISGVGNREYTTKVINSCLNPEWNETFDLLVEDLVENSTLNMSVYDKDLKNDDFLGG